MRIVCISDTHTMHKQVSVPDGDVLLHAGDFTNKGDLKDVYSFANWMLELPHKHKIVIAGNHDFCFENENFYAARDTLNNAGITFLQDSGCTVESDDGSFELKIYGTPWQPWFHSWAFNLRSESELKQKWDQIWPDADVLLVHGPPAGHLDKTQEGVRTGSKTLTTWIEQHQPKLVVCGHIHEDRGVSCIGDAAAPDTWIVNASCVTRRLKIQPYPPFVFETEDGLEFTKVDL